MRTAPFIGLPPGNPPRWAAFVGTQTQRVAVLTRRAMRLCALAGLPALSACAPVVRPANHRGADSAHAHATLVGPYDGQVLDAQTGNAIEDAVVMASWDYNEGDGFVVPLGRELFVVRTDAAGRYRIPTAPLKTRSSTARLSAFTLSISKPGYLPYRSDQDAKGRRRRDFSQRNHSVKLSPALPTSSSLEQLVYRNSLAARSLPRKNLRKLANLELYRIQAGLEPSQSLPKAGAAPEAIETPPAREQWLDANGLLDVDGLRTRTGSMSEFVVQELKDLPRSAHYHGVHFRAKKLDVRNDFAYRVWFEPPEGLAAVADLLQENLPNAQASSIITEQSWTFENEELRAVAFVSQSANAAVLLTCGVDLCTDLDTAILVAKHLERNLDALTRVDAPRGDAAKTPTRAPTPSLER